jgi:hypothetical protein
MSVTTKVCTKLPFATVQKLLKRRAYLITQMKELRDRLAELDLTIALLRGEAEPGPTPPAKTADAPTARRRKNVKHTVNGPSSTLPRFRA